MKKILFVFSLLLVFVMAGVSQTLITWTKSADSLLNTTPVNLTMAVRGSYDHAVFQLVVTKVSGTVAGNAKLYGSVDGTNYALIRAAADSLALTDVTTNSKIWEMDSIKYPYYKIVATGKVRILLIRW
jgi:hypothetical protein